MIRELAKNAGSHERAKELATPILDECAKLQKVDVVEASLLKANVYALTGEAAEVERWIKNAEQNRAPKNRIAMVREICYFLTGQISKAYSYFDEATADGYPDLAASINKCMACGWFEKAVHILESTPHMVVPPAVVETAKRALELAKESDLDDKTASLVMDHVHGTMVNHGLIWLDVAPSFTLLGAQHGGPVIHISFRIAETPSVAAELSWELATALSARKLDSKGLLVSFRGTMLEDTKAPAFA